MTYYINKTLCATVLTSFMLVGGCNNEKFRSSNSDIKGAQRGLSFPCANGNKTSNGIADVSGPENTAVTVKGQFCTQDLNAQKSQDVSVVLINDFSGSMADSTGGSDPLRPDGTCGRLMAARNIVQRLGEVARNPGAGKVAPRFKIANLVFGSSAEVRSSFGEVDRLSLSADDFCGADMRSTNYEAAFNLVRETVANITGTKIVIFTSDGIPTTFGSGTEVLTTELPKTRGAQAASALRNIPGVELYIVYLKYPKVDASNQVPNEYLLQLTGNRQERLKIADNAADLVNLIDIVDLPKTVTLGSVAATARLRSASGQEQNIAVTVTELDKARGIYEYITSPMTFSGVVGQPIVYTLKVSAQTNSGAPLESISTLNFTRSN